MKFPPPENGSANKDYFFLLGRWVNTEPAKLFAVFEDFGLLKTLAANFPSFFDVCSFLAIVISPIKKSLRDCYSMDGFLC